LIENLPKTREKMISELSSPQALRTFSHMHSIFQISAQCFKYRKRLWPN